MTRPQLIIFTKAPYLGKAKSRLAKGVGKVHANRLYRAMVRRVLRNVQDPRWDITLAVTPDKDLDQSFGGVWPSHIQRCLQGSGSLTPRLAMAFLHKGPVIVIGTDAPQIRKKDIAQAVKSLRGKTDVFGPADDGGFWLMAMKGPVDPALFSSVRWSTQYALSDITNRLPQAPVYLRTLIDVDDIDALRAMRSA